MREMIWIRSCYATKSLCSNYTFHSHSSFIPRGFEWRFRTPSTPTSSSHAILTTSPRALIAAIHFIHSHSFPLHSIITSPPHTRPPISLPLPLSLRLQASLAQLHPVHHPLRSRHSPARRLRRLSLPLEGQRRRLHRQHLPHTDGPQPRLFPR